jgi:predicted signal transduction protein with EAL and GGDEF domain
VFTTSFGVAPADDEASYEELVSRADSALYQAKQAGRNRTVVHVEGSAPTRSVVPAAVPTDVLPTDVSGA